MAARPADPGRFARIHRVRDVQARMAQADEARAKEKAVAEASLAARIAALAEGVSPTLAPGSGAGMQAAAHFRERLQASAATAVTRQAAADAQLDRSRAATRDALRDRTVAEKLWERARAGAAAADARREDEPPVPRSDRHDPC